MRFLDNSNFLIYKLSDLSEKICSGKDKIVENNNGEYPIYGSTGCIGYSPNYSYKGKKILVARVGAHAGYCYLVNGHYSVTDNTLIISPLNSDLFEYLFYCIVSKQLHKLSFGSGQPLVTGSQLSSLKVSIPQNNEEMNRVANLMKLLDERIDTQNKIIEEIISLKNSIIQQIFSNRGLIPNTNKVSLNKILVPGSKTPVDTSQYKKITIKLNYGGIEFSNIEREMKDTRPFYVRKTGELIIGKQNYFNGSIAILDEKYDGTICSNAIMSFIFDKEVDPVFVFTAVSNRQFLKAKSFYANGTGQKELSEKDFLNFEIGLPNINIQKKIGTLIENLDKKLKVEKINLELLMQQKQYLLANLFI